jgi:hypothetical protein
MDESNRNSKTPQAGALEELDAVNLDSFLDVNRAYQKV